MKIDYDDIPRDQLRLLRKEIFKRNSRIKWWSAFSCATAILLASSIARGAYPPHEDLLINVILLMLLAGALIALFWKAVVDPQIRRAVEKEYNRNVNSPKP